MRGRKKSVSTKLRSDCLSAAAFYITRILRCAMVPCSNRSYFVNLRAILLLLIDNCRIHASVLTYDSCMSDTTNSYKVGGWCFLFYKDSSSASKKLTQDDAQSVCHPHGRLAVGVTYKMLNTLTTYTSPSTKIAWIALFRNNTSDKTKDWIWKTRLPNGDYAVFPAIMSNIPWGVNEPDNGYGKEYAALLTYHDKVCDSLNNLTTSHAAQPMAVICQFAPRNQRYSQRGNGLFQVAAYRIAQTTDRRLGCILQCYQSLFCISLAFNPTTNDCQLYAVSPEDPRFAGNVTANSAYEFYIRDGMEY